MLFIPVGAELPNRRSRLVTEVALHLVLGRVPSLVVDQPEPALPLHRPAVGVQPLPVVAHFRRSCESLVAESALRRVNSYMTSKPGGYPKKADNGEA